MPASASAQRSCDLCRGEQFEPVSQRDRRGRSLTTVVCRSCGLVSHGEIPSVEQLAQYYEQQYRRDYNGEETPSARRVAREWQRGRERFEAVRPFLRSGDHVFEIGSGIGCNLKHFELAGFEAAGIEPGAGFSKFSQSQMHCQVQQLFLEDLPLAPSHDVMLLIHVLEHMRSPSATLRRIRDLLKPGGRLYVEVPNIGAPHAAPNKLFHFAHIYNFTPWTLAMFAEANGFAVTQLLSAERDRNLAMLLTRRDAMSLTINPSSYERTMNALRRYSTFTYHARPGYLWERAREMAGRLAERVTSPRQFTQILSQCHAHASKQLSPNVSGPRLRSVA